MNEQSALPVDQISIVGLSDVTRVHEIRKAFLCAAAARTIPDLWEAIRIAIDAFTPTDCQNYFAATGYNAI